MINIEQVKKDFDNGVIISKETIRQVIELAGVQNKALQMIAAIEDKTNGGDWDEIEEARQLAKIVLAANQ